MKRKYNQIIDEVSGQVVYWYLENGFKISFVADSANSDYQAYLEDLAENPVEDEE
jgi:uncharacterized iron-regulated protein